MAIKSSRPGSKPRASGRVRKEAPAPRNLLAEWTTAAGLGPDIHDAVVEWLAKQLVSDQFAKLEQGSHQEGRVPLRKVFVDLPITERPGFDPGHGERRHFLKELLALEPAPLCGDTVSGSASVQPQLPGLFERSPLRFPRDRGSRPGEIHAEPARLSGASGGPAISVGGAPFPTATGYPRSLHRSFGGRGNRVSQSTAFPTARLSAGRRCLARPEGRRPGDEPDLPPPSPSWTGSRNRARSTGGRYPWKRWPRSSNTLPSCSSWTASTRSVTTGIAHV
jgi:hypothetical protein